jgi:hypothetical protein
LIYKQSPAKQFTRGTCFNQLLQTLRIGFDDWYSSIRFPDRTGESVTYASQIACHQTVGNTLLRYSTVEGTLSRGRGGECDSSMIGPNGIDNRGATLIDNLLQWPSNFKTDFKEAERQVS